MGRINSKYGIIIPSQGGCLETVTSVKQSHALVQNLLFEKRFS